MIFDRRVGDPRGDVAGRSPWRQKSADVGEQMLSMTSGRSPASTS